MFALVFALFLAHCKVPFLVALQFIPTFLIELHFEGHNSHRRPQGAIQPSTHMRNEKEGGV
jgi:hypothetical protein